MFNASNDVPSSSSFITTNKKKNSSLADDASLWVWYALYYTRNECLCTCVCVLYLCFKHVCTSFTHTQRSPTLQEVSIWASYFLLCSPLPLRNGSGALMRTRRSVSLCNTSWNHGQRRAKEKSTKRVCCFIRAVANFHIAFFLQFVFFLCFIALNFCAHFSQRSWITATSTGWGSNSLQQQQQQRESLLTLEAFELKSSLWETYCYCWATKSPAPREIYEYVYNSTNIHTFKTGRLHGQGPARGTLRWWSS